MGLHESTIEEIRERLGFSERRMVLIDGLERYLGEWTQYGLLDLIVIDGSFVTDKVAPGDIDILLVPRAGSLGSVEWVGALQYLSADRVFTKLTFECEAFPTGYAGSLAFKEDVQFFIHDKLGDQRGLLSISMVS